jgi:protein-disulfide isomerase
VLHDIRRRVRKVVSIAVHRGKATAMMERGQFMPVSSTIALLAGVLLVSTTGCRDPLMGEESWTPDASGFDAAPDDAGPGELCPPGSENPFNNAYSNYCGGEESVDLAVVSFSYFRCPHCADLSELVRDVWADRPEFRQRVRFYYHHFPFENQTAWRLHACAEAAGRQGMEHFWAVHDLLYDGANADQPKIYSVDEVVAYVDDVLNLDMDQFDADRESEAMMSFLVWDKSQGQAVGVAATPSVFVCGEKIYWPNLEEVVDGYLDP